MSCWALENKVQKQSYRIGDFEKMLVELLFCSDGCIFGLRSNLLKSTLKIHGPNSRLLTHTLSPCPQGQDKLRQQGGEAFAIKTGNSQERAAISWKPSISAKRC